VATRRVYLVRHGEYDWDDQPDPSKGLTARGVQQARLTAQRFRSVPATAIYSSDLMRAVETAQIIAAELAGVPCKTEQDLRECFLPSPAFTNVPADVIQAGEKQAAAAFSKYLSSSCENDTNEIIVTHGNLIRYMVSRVLGGGNSWLRMRTFNCGVTEITSEPGDRLWLVSYNDVGHLPSALVTAGVPQRMKDNN
jgi:broad specificity phosphatase PhoE